jgi:hypothetical protein
LFAGPFGYPGIFVVLQIVGSALIIALVVGVVVFLIRSDGNDVRGRRPYAAYLFVVMFASLLTLLGAAGALAQSVGIAITDIGGELGQRCTFSATARPLQAFPEPPSIGTITTSPFPILTALPAPTLRATLEPVPQPFPLPREECFSIGASGQGGPAARAGIVGAVAAAVLAFHAVQARRLIAKEVSGA